MDKSLDRSLDKNFDKLLIVYDDKCGFCLNVLRWIPVIDWLGLFSYVGYSEYALKYPDVGDLNDGVRLRFLDESVYIGLKAVRSILVRTPLGSLPGLALYIPGIYHLGKIAYRYVATNRYKFCKINPG